MTVIFYLVCVPLFGAVSLLGIAYLVRDWKRPPYVSRTLNGLLHVMVLILGITGALLGFYWQEAGGLNSETELSRNIRQGGGPIYGLLLVGLASGLIIRSFVLRNRAEKRVLKSAPNRSVAKSTSGASATSAASGAVKYCHECGQPVEPGDRFCGNCGTAVKGAS